MNRLQTWHGVKVVLEARRTALNEEIAGYPAPITACDAQFNHLLEARRQIRTELSRLEAARAVPGTDVSLSEFLRSSTFLHCDDEVNGQ